MIYQMYRLTGLFHLTSVLGLMIQKHYKSRVEWESTGHIRLRPHRPGVFYLPDNKFSPYYQWLYSNNENIYILLQGKVVQLQQMFPEHIPSFQEGGLSSVGMIDLIWFLETITALRTISLSLKYGIKWKLFRRNYVCRPDEFCSRKHNPAGKKHILLLQVSVFPSRKGNVIEFGPLPSILYLGTYRLLCCRFRHNGQIKPFRYQYHILR